MKIAVTGMSGLIGTALAARFVRDGHDVTRLVRRAVRPGEHAIAWYPALGTIDREALDRWGGDVVVHLAGEPVFGRWTAAKKARIRDSRVSGTGLLSEAIAALGRRPRVLLTASAVGYYGDRGAEDLTEASKPGDDFLARVARDWEAAAAPAAAAGIRVVHLRFGVVLSPRGGALAKMLIPFRLGLGGPLGSGHQYFSWIALDDVVEVVSQLLANDSIGGPINVTAPEPVTNGEFARALGRVLSRPAVIPVPPFALQLAFGAEAASVMMGGQRVRPARLSAGGFRFRCGTIEPALRHLLAAPHGAP
ncbi:MAG TPA: TIGR01777 family oxidoreductase [Gemmatimonadales bacterium]